MGNDIVDVYKELQKSQFRISTGNRVVITSERMIFGTPPTDDEIHEAQPEYNRRIESND